MSSLYIGVYSVLYAYEAQTEEELNVQPDDILYLLEKSTVDDWWKVKKRVLPVGDEEVDEPVGLVPSNYIEPAPVVNTCNALYDYTKQTEEELTFSEGDQFNIYDMNDPDWLLVGNVAGTEYGFVPSNYVQLGPAQSQPPPQAVPAAQPATQAPISSFAPPPQHISRQQSTPPQSTPPQSEPEPVAPVDLDEEPEYEPEPPMPSRPRPQESDTESLEAPPMPSRPREPEEDLEAPTEEHTFDGEFFKWFINEVDGRKKKSVVLAIGKGLIILKPQLQSPKRKLRMRSSSTIDNEWRLRDLTNFNHEKKHLFLEFKNPSASVELHCGSKDVADAIMSILGDLKGAETARGLREVERASIPSSNGNRKIGRLIYDFVAQGDDELGCREGDEVYIIDQNKSPDWWMCENIDTGKQGVVPSSYIEIIGSQNLDKLTEAPPRQRSVKKSSRNENKRKAKEQKSRDREEREKIREKDRIEREKASSKRNSSDKSMPNFHRVRTWIDSSGSFKVEAEFLGCIEGKIHLHKTNGVKIAVSATKLSIEDLEYVEKVTGTSLESYKDEVAKQNAKRKAAMEKKSGIIKNDESPKKSKSATALINDVPPPQPTRPKSSATTSVSEPEYDWFDFFLTCGIDIGNCQRYTLSFNREQMDENILEDITPSLLRTLGLREGDIIRVMKFLDNKYGRKREEEQQVPAATGGLFTNNTGALKNNSSSEISKVDAKALPTPAAPAQPTQPAAPVPESAAPSNKSLMDDDAWAIKPAARSNEDLAKPQAPQQPQYTGSLQDLVNIKPIDLSAGSVNTNKPVPALPNNTTPSAPALQPVKTGTLIQPNQQFTVQKTGNGSVVSPQKTGTLIPVQRTGGLVPVMTGGFISAQPTGFIPITAQPTGFMPIQATGALAPQFTVGGSLIPRVTGQANGGMPPVTFNQPSLQTGTMTMPQTTFGQQPMFTQVTGGLPQQITGGLPQQITGGLPQQITGGAPPPTSFGQFSVQQTGPLIPTQRTGPTPQMPQTSFGQMPQNTFQPQSTFQPQNTFQPQSSFGQSMVQQNTFGQSNFNNNMNQMTGMFQNTSISQQPSFGQPQTSFGQPPTSFGQPQPSFGQQPMFGQQPTFGQPTLSQQPTFGQMQQPQTSFGQPPTFGLPQTSFGQNQFEGFGNGQLQSQPTGSGFGNAPLQNQPTGKRANLLAATPDNPFGF